MRSRNQAFASSGDAPHALAAWVKKITIHTESSMSDFANNMWVLLFVFSFRLCAETQQWATVNYVAIQDWTAPVVTASVPVENTWQTFLESDRNAGRNCVRLTNLMTSASLIVEAVCESYPAIKQYNSSNLHEIVERNYENLSKMRIKRILGSRWSEDETRARLSCSNNTLYLFVAHRPAVDSGVVNNPWLILGNEYMLWLKPLNLSDEKFSRIQSYAYEPINRNAIYAACIGNKGCIPIAEKRRSLPVPSCSTDTTNMLAQMDRHAAEYRHAYYMNSYNTTNLSDIVNAVRHLSRAMSDTAEKQADVNEAKHLLNAPKNINMEALTVTQHFIFVDYAVPEK